MKRLFFILLFLPMLTLAQSRKQRKAEEKADKESLIRLKTNIEYLSDDKLEGRRAGTTGEKLAMQYIVGQFKNSGLEPKGTDGYLQAFPIDAGKQMNAESNTLVVNDQKLELKKDYFPLAFSGNGSVSGSAAMSLREKGTPWFWDVKEIVEDNKDNPHFDIASAIQKEANTVAERGARALILYNSTAITDNIRFFKHDTAMAARIPVIYIYPAAVKKYFNDVTAFYDLKLQVHLESKTVQAHNIIGYINNNAPNTVVLGAHYDHLGYGEDGNTLDGAGEIHNGADDNASGTAALIELAYRLKNAKAKNNNYLFIAFSGEELGLLGSKYWLSHPTVSVNPNYMVNMDMIGRYDTAKKLTIGGYGTSPAWDGIFKTTRSNNLNIHFDSSGSGPSDHFSFYQKQIPVLFFFTNTHSDYHKSTDDWEKINFEAELNIIKYINQVIEATDAKGKLEFLRTRDLAMSSVSLPVTLGIMPDYSFTGSGVKIDGVSKNKPAEKAGLLSGDVLLQLGEYKFSDISSYMEALQHFKKGEETRLYIQRNGKEQSFEIRF